MDWLIILGTLTALVTFTSQLSATIKNVVDTYYKIREEKEKSRSHQEDDSHQ